MTLVQSWFLLELLRTVLGTTIWRASFLCSKKHAVVHNVFVFVWAQGPWGPGPWSPLGPWAPPMFLIFLIFCKMVQDLSKSVPMVFRSPGTPLIKLFHFIFNSKCHFSEVHFLYNCLLHCLLYCLYIYIYIYILYIYY